MTSRNIFYFILFWGGVMIIKKRNQITLSNDKQQFETQQIESIVPSFPFTDVTRNSLVTFT